MSKLTPDTAVYTAILKMDEQPDGTLLVYGKATDDTLDSDEQVCDPAWLKAAMPEWFKWGNIREQHGSTAAGVATEYKADGSEHFITAHVVDPGSVAKCKAGVLKGFSIGIRKARVVKDNKAVGGRIVDGQIVEISLVDRPANPACTLMVAKADGAGLVQVEQVLKEDGERDRDEQGRYASGGGGGSAESHDTAGSVSTESGDQHEVHDSMQGNAGGVTPEQHFELAGESHWAENAHAENYDAANLQSTLFVLSNKSVIANITKEQLMQANNIVETSKKFASTDITKFDQGAFDAARQALATLIQVEAGEMAQGSDETYSLQCLLSAVHALMSWHEGEAAEGETTPLAEMIEMADEPDTSKDVEMCDKCDKSMDECKCAEGGYSAEEKSEDTTEPVKALTISDVRDIVADVLKTLQPTTTVGEEMTKATDSERVEALETELAQVKALAAPTGPKRMGAASSTPVNTNLTKAAQYRAKARLTDDRTLAKGFLELAIDLEKNPT